MLFDYENFSIKIETDDIDSICFAVILDENDPSTILKYNCTLIKLKNKIFNEYRNFNVNYENVNGLCVDHSTLGIFCTEDFTRNMFSTYVGESPQITSHGNPFDVLIRYRYNDNLPDEVLTLKFDSKNELLTFKLGLNI